MVMAAVVHKKYALGDFALEPDKRLLTRAGTPVHLAHKPYQVLLYLIEQRERIVPRQELLGKFWEGHDVYEVALSKCVGAIRKALNDQLDQPRFIETRWAEGYRYVGPLEEQLLENGSSIIEIEKTRGVKIVVEEDDEQETLHAPEKAIAVAAASPPFARPFPLKPAHRPGPLVLVAACVVLVAFATGALFFSRHRSNAHESPPAPLRSVAVLPLKNLTGDAANEYFSDGITDSLITALSKIDGLRVSSRGSVLRFKETETDPVAVGKQLKVAAVLEGSVRKDEESVRVAVRLVSAEDGRILWVSDTKDRALLDIFALQDEIARHVVAGLSVQLNREGERRLTKRYTDNVAAYQLYLRGRYHLDKRRVADIEKASQYFEQAVALDPDYALAYAALSRAYAALGSLGALPTRDIIPKVNAATARALELDGQLAEAHASLASTMAHYNWDWLNAEREYKRALELDPNSADVHQSFASVLMCLGRFDEAIAEIKRAQELAPVSVRIDRDVGQILFFARRYDEAIESLQKTLDMDPNFVTAYGWLELAYEQKGDYDQAVEAYLKQSALEGDPKTIAALRKAYTVSGWKGFWRKRLDLTKERAKQKYVRPHLFAAIYVRLGDKDQALAYLEKAAEERESLISKLKVHPLWDSLRSDPRFTDLVRRVGLAP